MCSLTIAKWGYIWYYIDNPKRENKNRRNKKCR
nr:MAG TPA: hypothetical protein [Caudoviricetes sp.]